MARTKNKTRTSSPNPAPIIERGTFALDALHLDVDNPRFGGTHGRRRNERELLNVIADVHDVSDVLSSISTNGYLDSEPLIGARNKGGNKGVTIVEGNRRLAACLILAADERARDQKERRTLYLPSQFAPSDQLPVFVYDWANEAHRRKLLPYLGIRHIVGPLQWDSYAKAAWVASVLEEGVLTLDEIIRMTGDKNRTMVRLLEGFHFVNQVEQAKAYEPQASMRSGRGSKPEYPFSWVYNALDYDAVRTFVGLGQRQRVPAPNPVPRAKIENAGELMSWMFGDGRKGGHPPAIKDSRELKRLAQALTQRESLRELRKHEPLDVAIESARPKRERVLEKLESAAENASEALALLPDLTAEEAAGLTVPAERLTRQANAVRKTLFDMQSAEEGLPADGRK
ncbi:MAG TPA: hypothetical protein VK324_16190 [Tepidisphaeraceae bacterium]|nr:hypothetical protein [Tepidisphaeraceae bacterium]